MIFQSIASGLLGVNGLHVLRHVEKGKELRIGQYLQQQETVVRTVMALVEDSKIVR